MWREQRDKDAQRRVDGADNVRTCDGGEKRQRRKKFRKLGRGIACAAFGAKKVVEVEADE